MTADIVERLKSAADHVARKCMGETDLPAFISIPRKPTDIDAVLCEAADRISALLTENEELRRERNEALSLAASWSEDCQEARVVLEQSRKVLCDLDFCGPSKHGHGDEEINRIDRVLTIISSPAPHNARAESAEASLAVCREAMKLAHPLLGAMQPTDVRALEAFMAVDAALTGVEPSNDK